MTVRILVVDDSPVDRRVVEFFVKKGIEGAHVFSVSNGQTAIEAIHSNAPDLIVTDLQMPQMDGLELVENLISQGQTIPVILMTGYGSEQIAVQALRAGAASYVPKRRIDQTLVETIENVLSHATWQRIPQREVHSLDEVELKFCLENDPSQIPPLIAYLQDQLLSVRFQDHYQITRIGIAIQESLKNAMYCGNFELDRDQLGNDKSLIDSLMEERRRNERFAARRVRLSAWLSGTEVRLVVSDEGSGYNSTELSRSTDEINLDQLGGRGLLLIRCFMNEVSLNPAGNEITMVNRMLKPGWHSQRKLKSF